MNRYGCISSIENRFYWSPPKWYQIGEDVDGGLLHGMAWHGIDCIKCKTNIVHYHIIICSMLIVNGSPLPRQKEINTIAMSQSQPHPPNDQCYLI